MSFKDEDIEKIYRIKNQLLVTFKAANKEEQKKRISQYLKDIEIIIKEIESGNWVNPVKLNIITQSLKEEDTNGDGESSDSGKYIDRIEFVKLSESNKDYELDQIYSFMTYFEDNFIPPLSQSNLKLDYSLGKRRDDFYVVYDTVKHLMEEFVADYDLLCRLTNKEQISKYKERLYLQKQHLLVKIRELLNHIKEFLMMVVNDLNEGRKSLFNANEKYVNRYSNISKKIEFEGKNMEYIVREAQIFIDEFISVLRMPDFKK